MPSPEPTSKSGLSDPKAPAWAQVCLLISGILSLISNKLSLLGLILPCLGLLAWSKCNGKMDARGKIGLGLVIFSLGVSCLGFMMATAGHAMGWK